MHYMEHPNYPEALGVGCVCAGHMADDYEGAREREGRLKSTAHRRRRWTTRKWKTSAKGNPYLNVDGLNITVFRRRSGKWGARITDRETGDSRLSKLPYKTMNDAKLAAFETMIFLQQERGWGL